MLKMQTNPEGIAWLDTLAEAIGANLEEWYDESEDVTWLSAKMDYWFAMPEDERQFVPKWKAYTQMANFRDDLVKEDGEFITSKAAGKWPTPFSVHNLDVDAWGNPRLETTDNPIVMVSDEEDTVSQDWRNADRHLGPVWSPEPTPLQSTRLLRARLANFSFDVDPDAIDSAARIHLTRLTGA